MKKLLFPFGFLLLIFLFITPPTYAVNIQPISSQSIIDRIFGKNIKIGSTGATGLQGPIGATGLQGPIGITGPTGLQGVTGITGPMGSTGLQGLTGIQGPIGVTGEMGSTGATGEIGPIGATGLLGSSGLKGDTGATGLQGATGVIDQASLNTIDGQISSLGNRVSNLEQNTYPDFQVSIINSKGTFTGHDQYDIGVEFNVFWNNIDIASFTTSRAIFHSPSGDYYNLANGHNIHAQIPLNGPTPIPVDLYVFWQGTIKHVTVTVVDY